VFRQRRAERCGGTVSVVFRIERECAALVPALDLWLETAKMGSYSVQGGITSGIA
jgi:hypothetical protein